MRALFAGMVVGVCLIGSADATNLQQLYYWEDENPAPGLSWDAVPPRMARYGWSDSPRGLRVTGPVRRAPNEGIWSYCARQVGRIVLIDNFSLIRSIQMTDACVRNGGRL